MRQSVCRPQEVERVRVKSIHPAGRADVYNMEVEGTHNYAIEGGVIVHNCRYVLMENPISPRLPADKPIRAIDPLGRDVHIFR